MAQRLKKPYISLLGEPILAHTLRVLDSVAAIALIVVPVFPGEETFCEEEVIKKISLTTPVSVIAGGGARQDSVRNALERVSDHTGMVLIHDGARPLITPSMIESALEATSAKRATTMGVPVKDTTVMVSRDDCSIHKALPRDRLFAIQTPQTFEKELILTAHQKAAQDGFTGTDDAGLVQRLGVPVTVIPGSYRNIKITTADDLLVAEAILSSRQTPRA